SPCRIDVSPYFSRLRLSFVAKPSRAWTHRDVRVSPLQGLHPRLLVRADDLDALLGQGCGLLVHVAYRLHLRAKHLGVFGVGVQPVAALMRLEVGLLLKNAPRSGARCG